jgi:ATP-dependent Clp protease ATP-binding subunit ClpB
MTEINRMTVKLQEALQAASAHARRRSHQGLDVEHLLLGLMEQEAGLAGSLFEQAGVSPAAVRKAAEAVLDRLPQVEGPGSSPGQFYLTERLSQVLVQAEQEM